MEALDKQARKMAVHPWVRVRKFSSLFVGGGTPTSIEPQKLAAVIQTCLADFNYLEKTGKQPEVTVEVNPATVTKDVLKQLGAAGVNRLSIGVQAFSDTMLKNLGRLHTVRDNLQTFEWGREAGFSNISLDLMYGLPGQEVSTWEKTLKQAAALQPEHLSVYELTIEADTPFYGLAQKKLLDLPPEKTILEMFNRARNFLAARGYNHYEISNYSRHGFVCSHNINYWENGSYLGLGAGAVSCFSGVRIKSVEDPDWFIKLLEKDTEPYAEAEFMPLEARFRETVIMGLRLTDGVSIKGLKDRFGMTPKDYYGELLAKLLDDKLLEEKNSRLRLTRPGLLIANRVMMQLV